MRLHAGLILSVFVCLCALVCTGPARAQVSGSGEAKPAAAGPPDAKAASPKPAGRKMDAAKRQAIGNVTVTFDADVLVYSGGERHVEGRGNVRVTATASGVRPEPMTITAEELDADLTTGSFKARNNVTVRTKEGSLKGDTLEYAGGVFTLTRAACAMNIGPGPDPGSVIRAYAFGDKIERKGKVVFVGRGKITTCDLDNPHWSVTADKITADPVKDEVTVDHPKLQFFGWRIPLLNSATRRMSTGREVSTTPFELPGHSSRDGWNLPYYLQFGPQTKEQQSDLDFRFSQKRGVRGLLRGEKADGPWQADLYISREEDVTTVLQNFLAVNRKPEFVLTRNFAGPHAEGEVLSLSASIGRFEEQDLDLQTATFTPPTIATNRYALIARYRDRTADEDHKVGHWGGAYAAKYWYGGSEGYHDIALTLGGGIKLGDKTRAALTVIRHFEGGVTPLLYDQVQIPTELQPFLDLRLAPKWDLESTGRYDWNTSKLRDYTMELRRINHCISWFASYRFVGHHVGFGVQLNGLTNDIPDYHPKDIVPPLPPLASSGAATPPAATPAPSH
jgi:hypothetical protein